MLLIRIKRKKQIFDTLQTTFCPHEDYEKEPLAVQFENAVSKGLEVNASICAGKMAQQAHMHLK